MKPSKGDQMTMSGFCAYPSEGSHKWCHREECPCECHKEKILKDRDD